MQEIEQGIEPGKVYTLCFWSASRFLDLMGAACLQQERCVFVVNSRFVAGRLGTRTKRRVFILLRSVRLTFSRVVKGS